MSKQNSFEKVLKIIFKKNSEPTTALKDRVK